MYSNLRSLIFKLDPEKAHTLAIQSLKFNLVSNVFDENKNDPIFKTQIFGKDLSNPIGIAAGFDKNAEVYNPLFKLGFGFVEVGTVTPFKQYGNEKPRVFRLVEDQALIKTLEKCNDQMPPEEIQTLIYSTGKENGYAENLRDWFKLIYEVVFGDENGPRMGFFISFFGVKETKDLIMSKLK